jgi:pimeloyl-ACP methyl ester carboxylesterase
MEAQPGKSSMHVHEIGSGTPVLLLHGAPSPASDLLPLARGLATRHRVLIPDLPGYDASPALDDFSYPRVGRALAELLVDRGASRLHAIVGFSGGAYRALHLVLRCGIHADSIVGLGTIATLDDASRESFRTFAAMIEADPSAPGSPALRSVMAERMLSATWRSNHPADGERVADWLQLMTPSHFAAELRATAELPDLRAELPSLSSRLFLRVGEHDVATPATASQEIARLVAVAGLDVVPGCGHALLLEDAEATIAAVMTAVG